MHKPAWIILILGAALGALALGGCAATGASTAPGPTPPPTSPSVPDGSPTIHVDGTRDVDDAVLDAVQDTLALAEAEWGLGWNVDYYVIGADAAAAQAFLEGTYCPRGVEQGRYADVAACLERNPKEKVDVGTGAPRYVGLMEYHQYSLDPGSSAARTGEAPMHVFFHSLPPGLAGVDPDVPADDDLAVVLHEFWSTVQVEHTGETTEAAAQPKMGPVWFVEGAQEYMGQRLRSDLRAAGTLPDDVGNADLTYGFRDAMERVATRIDGNAACHDRRLTEFVAYGGECGFYGIDLGTWAMAYMHSLPGVADDAMTETLQPAVASDGWKAAFETTVGMTLAAFETRFHAFLDQPLEAQLAILPAASDPPAGGRPEGVVPADDVAERREDGTGAFRTHCLETHVAFDDPLVHPGEPGAAHEHVFLGNPDVDAFTTADTLLDAAETRCDGGTANRSGYWVPALYDADGDRMPYVEPLIYYKTGYHLDPATLVPPPAGLRMIAGNAMATAPQDTAVTKFRCSNWSTDAPQFDPGDPLDHVPTLPDCEVGDILEIRLVFPQCWDGEHLTSDDLQSHMAYPSEATAPVPGTGSCPASHPVAIPEISYNFEMFVTDETGPSSEWRFVTDPPGAAGGTTFHGDWMNGWNETVMTTLVERCLNDARDCDTGLLGDGTRLEPVPFD
ncbi:MAG: DUF1996 domain-containing protein [Trueperaceae bacterium]|nr:DUF1996 domain-containing protein [Trueperaceae bacterium]